LFTPLPLPTLFTPLPLPALPVGQAAAAHNRRWPP
jgi:hypothetical protein